MYISTVTFNQKDSCKIISRRFFEIRGNVKNQGISGIILWDSSNSGFFQGFQGFQGSLATLTIWLRYYSIIKRHYSSKTKNYIVTPSDYSIRRSNCRISYLIIGISNYRIRIAIITPKRAITASEKQEKFINFSNHNNNWNKEILVPVWRPKLTFL